LRRVTPIGRRFGADRGGPIDRHYIESFLKRNEADIRGRVLEAGGFVNYTRQFGEGRVTHPDVMYPREGFPDGTIVADLESGRGVPDDTYDCLILTQVFPFIYDLDSAVRNAYRALRPGGVLLATLPGISQISGYDKKSWGDYWRFTDGSARRLFGDVFGDDRVTVETHGNVLAACAFLHGLGRADVTPVELDARDPQYQVLISVRAERPGRDDAGPAPGPERPVNANRAEQ
jgi:SAM-dependent methyltransferase